MNIDLVVLSMWNLLTSNLLIQLFPDFNWTPQIVERLNFGILLFPWKLLSLCCVRTGRIPAFSKKGWQISLEECGIVYIRNISSDVTPGSRRRHTVRPYLTARHTFYQFKFKLKYFLVLGIIDKCISIIEWIEIIALNHPNIILFSNNYGWCAWAVLHLSYAVPSPTDVNSSMLLRSTV
jgi:hypothetical protein